MIYVLDTSVILSDPKSLERLKTFNIVIPLTVLEELEDKRIHPELGFAAREALRTLEEYRKKQNLTESIKNDFGGSIRIEVNNIVDSDLPVSFKSPTNDNKILAVASNLSKKHKVVLLTKDLPLRLKASVAGVKAKDYFENSSEVKLTGMESLDVTGKTVSELYENGTVEINDEFPDLANNTCLVLKSPTASVLARVKGNRIVRVKDAPTFGLSGRSAEQRLALDLLNDPELGIVSLGGPAGTGKSILALAAGLESVMERQAHKRVIIFRPLYPVGGQDLGFLPGTAEEKMNPWAAAVFDALEVFCGRNVIQQVIADDLLEVLPLTHIRGRTLSDSYVIVDEAQNLEKMVLLTALSRIGNNSKVVLTHDVAQRDNLRVGKHDGISSVISSLSGESLFAHISLKKSERSKVSELVSRLLEE